MGAKPLSSNGCPGCPQKLRRPKGGSRAQKFQEAHGNPRRPQEAPGGPGRLQKAPGGPGSFGRPREAPGGPRKPQEALKIPQAASRSSRRHPVHQKRSRAERIAGRTIPGASHKSSEQNALMGQRTQHPSWMSFWYSGALLAEQTAGKDATPLLDVILVL